MLLSRKLLHWIAALDAQSFKEASILASLNHPHIIHLYGMTKSGWLVMELADGDLGSLCTDSKLTWLTALSILEQAAYGLDYVHSKQPPLVHDVLSDSSFVYKRAAEGKYDVKLVGFG